MLIFGYFYVYLAIPEVKGLSLEEVDELYRAGVKPWRSSSWKPTEKHLHHHEKKASASTSDPTRVSDEDLHEEKEKA